MDLKEHSDFIGRIEPDTRSTCRVDCEGCEAVIKNDAPAFVYCDLTIPDFYLLCERCHQP